MNALLIKIMAVGLTVSQLFTKPPEQVKLNFNPQTEQALVTQNLKDGCAFMTKHFQAENISIEAMLATIVSNIQAAKERDTAPPATPGAPAPTEPPKEENFSDKMIKQIDFEAMLTAYKLFCKGENVEAKGIKLEEVINFYNEAMKNLPDANTLKTLKLPESAVVLDRSGQRFSEIYSENNRRLFVPMSQIPDHVKKAFVAAEDQNFYKHIGLDVVGIIRAFASNMMGQGRPQGGSTITQQVIKNLLLNDDITVERKMREMVLATRVEKIMTKDQILELYLNFVFLGRASWGVEMASKSYFGKSVKDINHAEAALLAALTKGPNYYNPSTHLERATDRRKYVIQRMKADGYINDQVFAAANADPIKLIAFESPHTRGAFYFLDAIQKEAKEKGLLGRPYVVRSTIHTELQKVAERSLQDGLAEYEALAGRTKWTGTQGSINDEIYKYGSSWKDVLPKVKAKLYDVQWPLAVVLDTRQPKVGLVDGRVVPLKANPSILRTLKNYDLIFVNINEAQQNTTASLRIPPLVQGAVIVLENKTGRVLSMAGGFSYAGSQLNRVYSPRQPGSTLKPFIYLSALNLGFQPNTLIPDTPANLPPIERGGRYWTPKNYDGGSRGLVTMRRAVEQSLNLPTVRMMSELGRTPTEGLDYVRAVTQELGIYSAPDRHYPFVLGAQPARLIDMALAYATIANDGLKPSVHFIESIEDAGKMLYQRPRFNLQQVPSVDRVAFYQMRRILSGTVVRGTAAKLKDLQGILAGKTGTSNDENDAWFIGFTNDIVVAVWVGYDSRHVRANLGDRFTGGRIALPIAEKIIRGSFTVYKEKEAISGPPAEIQAKLAEYVINLTTGEFNQQGDFREIFRRDESGQRVVDSTRRILRGNELAMGFGAPAGEEENRFNAPQFSENYPWQQPYPQQPYPPGYYRPGVDDNYQIWRERQRQVDPYLVNPPFYPRNPYGGQR